MTMLNINLVDRSIIGPIEITSVASAHATVEAIKGAVEILWKGAFAGETPAAPAPVRELAQPRKERRVRKVPTGEPKEGSYDARVLEVARRLETGDRLLIAAELGEKPIMVALALGRLKERGCL